MEDFSLQQTFPNTAASTNNQRVESSIDITEYLYIRVVKAKDLFVVGDIAYDPYVEVRVGNSSAFTSAVEKKPNPHWNQVFAFVSSKDQPFVDILLRNKHLPQGDNEEDGVKGRLVLDVNDCPLAPRWYKLNKYWEGGRVTIVRGELMLAVWVGTQPDEAWHSSHPASEEGVVLGDTTRCTSTDLRPPTVMQLLWKQQGIRFLELGILSASGLPHMKTEEGGRGRTDAYCVAKYGQKWVRTRTIKDSCSPQWNEHYTWEVYDPCTTDVIKVGVFDNCHGEGAGARVKIGKFTRIRLSALEMNRIYIHSYPFLAVLNPQGGVKRVGELRLAIRFSCSSSFFNLLQQIYTHPLPLFQREQEDCLRYQAADQLLSMRRGGRSEHPPLRREVVDSDIIWSHCQKIKVFVYSGIIDALNRWALGMIICSWKKKPILTLVVHYMVLYLVFNPEFILPTICYFVFLISFVTNCKNNEEALRFRYGRLRVGTAGKVQSLLGDLATQVERVQSLLNLGDPRAIVLFLSCCLVAWLVVCAIPSVIIIDMLVFHALRHPSIRSKLPSAPINFFRWLPATTTDSLI